ncbi:MAG: ECF-type sigma factor [Planctomycetota bacterium]
MASPHPDPQVTQLLQALGRGLEGAQDRLLERVYDELRALAAGHMRRESPGHTLQATALVHEAYLRLLGQAETPWENRAHFFGAAAQAMRRILVERHRRVTAKKRGGDAQRHSEEVLDAITLPGEREIDSLDLLALDEALAELEAKDPDMAKVVMLRFFAGLSVEETAAAMQVSPRTVMREWSVAKAWLYQRMEG